MRFENRLYGIELIWRQIKNSMNSVCSGYAGLPLLCPPIPSASRHNTEFILRKLNLGGVSFSFNVSPRPDTYRILIFVTRRASLTVGAHKQI